MVKVLKLDKYYLKGRGKICNSCKINCSHERASDFYKVIPGINEANSLKLCKECLQILKNKIEEKLNE